MRNAALRLLTQLLVACLVLVGRVAVADDEAPISAAQVRKHVDFLASPELRGRGDRESKQRAADYIVSHFEACGLKPLFQGRFLQPIPGPRRADGTPTVFGNNLGAWLPGSDPALTDEFVVIDAHYDHLGVHDDRIYPGADDNASGVAMLLEVARQIGAAKVKPRRSVVFLSFDLEENMLWGARWFAAHPPWPIERIKLFIAADMLGRSLGNLPLSSIFVLGSEHATGMKQVLADVGTPAGLEVSRLGIDYVGTRSDYGPFRAEKVPFLFFSSGEHPDYHTPRDTPDRVDALQVAKVSNYVLRICRNVADADETPAWSDTPLLDLDEVRTLQRIAEQLLTQDDAREAGDAGTLSAVNRLIVSSVVTRTSQILKRGELKADERPWLVRMAQVLLVTVF